jgi:hypothetical protein
MLANNLTTQATILPPSGAVLLLWDLFSSSLETFEIPKRLVNMYRASFMAGRGDLNTARQANTLQSLLIMGCI